MKIKLSSFIFMVLICIGLIVMAIQVNQMEHQKELEEKQSTVIQLLQEDLKQFDPTLEKFVDEGYKNVIASKISKNGICKFERGLAKNQDPFGNS
ncbi:hypothetical protein [Alkalihalobacillus sp. AL-G]|uniref:hypothetical protein n=1 Tax=Alkalihalobacillus sp. AL-G TaxID=2926399 RepID=UPI00272A697C|nr:hypothetical protein [Alkalihalobacillus sp. AL-G]WLD94334.1 hypothetical protein MOJ78_05435 [Alkalihalobacillus sp. AL-G]